jgi:hypothetical protein
MMVAVSFCVTSPLQAQTPATIAWDANPEPDVAGYLVLYGPQPGFYTNTVDVGKVTTRALNGLSLSPSTKYYFTVKAYNTSGLLSPASTELFYTTGANGGGSGGGGGPVAGFPTITSVAPNTGPKAGGTSITITGTNFVAGSLVSIGGFPATDITIVNATKITAKTPAGAVGARAVGVLTPSDQAVLLQNAFTFTGVIPMLVTSAPTSGPLSGGTLLNITGTNFNPNVGVLIGGAPSPRVTYLSPTAMTAVAPPRGNTGLVDVAIVEAGVVQSTISGAYRYQQVITSTDSDGDGMPDAWETQWGLDPTSAAGENGAAGDPDGDLLLNIYEMEQGSHPRGYVKRYFAEGVTNFFFDTRFALANPQTVPAHVLLEFLDQDGQTSQQIMTLAPHSRATVIARDIQSLNGLTFSTRVESDQIIVADRLMEWEATRYGSHAETAVHEPSTVWYFAEGATGGSFDLYYLLQNPTETTAEVDIRYIRLAGQAPITKHHTVPPRSRATVKANTEGPGLEGAEMSAEIRSTNDVPIIAERSMYFSRRLPYEAGHGSAGVTAPDTEWFLAEGATGDYFMMFVLIGNPSDQEANVHVTYYLSDGAPVEANYTVAPNSRYTINVGYQSDYPQLKNVAVASRYTSNVPILVERTMWWPGMPDQWKEGHNSFGVTSTGTKWVLAEGEEGGPLGTTTYVLVANTSAFAGQAKVTLMFEDGAQVSQVIQLKPQSRYNVVMDGPFAVAAGKRFATMVESIGETPAQIVVERAMYSNPRGEVWSSGSNAVATKLQ